MSAFDRLDPVLQRWVWEQGWESLRGFQEEAIHTVLDGEEDFILSASTASGKTEAVFLPLLSRRRPVLYVSPLKALINDQAERLGVLGERVGMPVQAWHGDVHSHRKARAFQNLGGVLLITPESLEALFVLKGPDLPRLFGPFDTVVVDELHVFLGTERGRQVQSLLHRMEQVVGRRIRRIGLSATLGNAEAAAQFLRAGTRVIEHRESGRTVKLQIRCDTDIVSHLYRTLRDSDNLIFCNRRSDVEMYTEALRKHETEPTFFPHHGSLARALREEVESRLQRGEKTTVVCTTTLELGIDFGQVSSVAQIGPPPSVAALFQRLGRSGRRGSPSVARIYISDTEPKGDELRPQLLQACAMVSLLLEGWMEPYEPGQWHLSTLVQQLLSLISERHGVTASVAWEVLCGSGPFASVPKPHFALILRSLGSHGLIEQAAGGLLMLAEAGARQVEHFSFYAAFSSSEEYTVRHGDQTLGTLPTTEPIVSDMSLLFAGRSWKVVDVDPARHLVQVVPAPVGAAPSFAGTVLPVHDRVRQRMRELYESDTTPRYLDSTAAVALQAARQQYRTIKPLMPQQEDVLLFPWRGDRILQTLRLHLAEHFASVVRDKAWLRIRKVEVEEVRGVLQRLLSQPPPTALHLASGVRNAASEKWDRYLPQELLWLEYGQKRLDPAGAHAAMRALFESSC